MNHTVESAVAMVVYKRRILDSIKAVPDNTQKRFEVTVELKKRLLPVFYVILYYVHGPSMTLCLHSVTYEVELSHHDGVSMQLHTRNGNLIYCCALKVFIDLPDKLEPGIEIMFNVKATQHSYVGLTAMDNRVYLLGDNMDNDFRQDYFDFIKSAVMESDIMLSNQPAVITSGLIFLTNAHNISSTNRSNFKNTFYTHSQNDFFDIRTEGVVSRVMLFSASQKPCYFKC